MFLTDLIKLLAQLVRASSPGLCRAEPHRFEYPSYLLFFVSTIYHDKSGDNNHGGIGQEPQNETKLDSSQD